MESVVYTLICGRQLEFYHSVCAPRPHNISLLNNYSSIILAAIEIISHLHLYGVLASTFSEKLSGITICDGQSGYSFASILHAGAVASPATGSFIPQPQSTPTPIDIQGKVLNVCMNLSHVI